VKLKLAVYNPNTHWPNGGSRPDREGRLFSSLSHQRHQTESMQRFCWQRLYSIERMPIPMQTAEDRMVSFAGADASAPRAVSKAVGTVDAKVGTISIALEHAQKAFEWPKLLKLAMQLLCRRLPLPITFHPPPPSSSLVLSACPPPSTTI